VLTKLDTLAQLSTKDSNPLQKQGKETIDTSVKEQQSKYQKRARAKTFTNAMLFGGLLDVPSKLHKAYWRTYHCNNLLLQNGNKISTEYCNQRWCAVCDRIRTAKAINGYKEPLSKLSDMTFATLTIPNVKGKHLKDSIELMQESFTRIRKNIAKTYGTKITGIRKLECTYNPDRDDYHPHYHLILEGNKTAQNLVSLWLKQYPKADIQGQDIRPADNQSLVELFKYFTKSVSKSKKTGKSKFYPRQMDVIYKACYRKRTLQPYGIAKVTEEIDEMALNSEELIFKESAVEIWGFEKDANDWISAVGETFSDYVPTEKDNKYIDKFNTKNNYEQPKEQEIRNENNRETTYEAKQGNTALWYEAIHNHQDSIRQLLPRK